MSIFCRVTAMPWSGFNETMGVAFVLLASVGKSNGLSKVAWPDACLDRTKLNSVVLIEQLVRVLYPKVGSCT